MTWEVWVALVAAVLSVSALLLAFLVYRQQREAAHEAGPYSSSNRQAREIVRQVRERGHLVAFVANPSKPDVATLHDAIVAAVTGRGLPTPLWLETTEQDPGVGQAKAAVAQGADVVVAVGGDGTVRAVAEGLVGTGIPMGLIPLGTGNLLARNLDLPIGDPMSAMRIAVTGTNRTIDVGWVRILEAAPDPGVDVHAEQPEHIFLVIAGVGFDAAMVNDTDDDLKARVGWIAYFISGIRHLHGRRLRTFVTLDGHPATATRLRSLLIGNCGRLPGGLTLLPDAVLDDGWLDVAAIDTRAGIAGWAQLFGEVVLQGVGVRTALPAKIGRIDHARAQTVHVRLSSGEHVQVDGDVIGRARELSARVDAGALVVRVPQR